MKKLFIVAIAAVAMLASSASAAEWDFYGSARMWTFSTDVETIGTAGSDRDTNWELSPYSRIGANVKVSDELSGRFEYGIMTAASDESVRLRLLYGEWNFGAGTLTVGQDYSPVYIAYSNQGYDGDGMGGTGDAYKGRSPQLKLSFGEFQIAAVSPHATAIAGGNVDTTLPRLEARYTFRFENGSARIVGGYNSFEERIAGKDESITSMVIAAGADFNLGAFRLAGNVVWGENAAALIAVDTNNLITTDGMARVNGAANGFNDSEILGFQIVLGYTLNDMISFEAGYGWIEEEVDNVTGEDEATNYYIQMPIVLAPGVTVTPEFGVYDYEEAGQMESTYFGAKWQINF